MIGFDFRDFAAVNPIVTNRLRLIQWGRAGLVLLSLLLSLSVAPPVVAQVISDPISVFLEERDSRTSDQVLTTVSITGSFPSGSSPLYGLSASNSSTVMDRFKVDENNGNVSYVGGGYPEDVVFNSAYSVIIEAYTNDSGDDTLSTTVTVNIGICDRTEAVRNRIVALVTPTSCGEVGLSDLGNASGEINVFSQNITSFLSYDFRGLSSLGTLNLGSNDELTSLPGSVFEGLSSLSTLELDNNSLTRLPANVFSGLSNLSTLGLDNNSLTSLPGSVFDDLSRLTTLKLNNNPLGTLPVDVFDDLYSLTTLELQSTSLSSLLVGMFTDLNSLETLDLQGTSLNSLPVDVFLGLGSLTTLELHNNSLTSLPDGVFNGLSNLTTLKLNNNPLGTLPRDVFFGLFSLTTLELQDTSLSNLVVGMFANQSSLLTLRLDNNLLTSLPFKDLFSALFSLLTLKLNNNSLVSLSADVFKGLGRLETLELHKNQLGALPANVFSGLTSLTRLTLLDNPTLSDLPAGVFAGLGRLETLGLENLQLSDLPAGAFAGLTSLLSLDLRNNQLSGLTVDAFVGLDSLRFLVLHDNRLDNNLPVGVFNGLGSLETLRLTANFSLSSLPVGVFARLSNLIFLNLYNNRLSSLPEGVFDGLGRLDELSINENRLNTLPARVFAGLSSLTKLHSQHNQLSTLPANVFAELGSLTMLDLRYNHLSGLTADVFAGLGNLTTLGLEGNQLGALPANAFRGLDSLTTLDLRDTQLSGLTADVFVGLDSLLTLDLRNNQLDDNLPVGVFNGLSLLTSLRLTANPSLSRLPVGVFVGLSNLTTLSLFENQLSLLPVGVFAGLGRLKTLILNDNQLTAASLPAGVFTVLSNLTTLDLSNNPSSNPAPFQVTLSLEQRMDFEGKPVFRVRNDFPAVAYQVMVESGGGGATPITVTLPPLTVGATSSAPFTVPVGSTTITITDFTVRGSFTGFITNIGQPLIFNTPLFGQPDGYAFHNTLFPTSASGTAIGQVLATDVNNTPLITYAITAPDDGGSTFSIRGDGVITYIGSGNETPGRLYNLTVTATNESHVITAAVTVTISVQGPPQFSATGSFFLTASNRSAIGVVAATDPNEETITYSLVAVSAEVPGTTTDGKFTIDSNNGTLSYIGSGKEDVTANTTYALIVRATAGGDFAEGTVMVNIGICDRTSGVRDLIGSRLSNTDCEAVTVAGLNSLNGSFRFSGASVGSIVLGDFDGLINVTILSFSGNNQRLSVVPAGVFDDMASLNTLTLDGSDLSGNRLSSGVFDNLNRLVFLNINGSELDNLPANLLRQRTNLRGLSLKDNNLSALSTGVFTGLTLLIALDLSDNPGAPFEVILGVEQLADSASSKVFQVRSRLPGPAYSEVAWEASGGSGAAATGTVMITAGTATSAPFTVPATAGHTVIALTGSTFSSGFSGFTTTFAVALTTDMPVFGTQGYVFETLDSSSTNGAILGTVSAVNPGDASTPDYTLTFTAPYPTITFSIDSNGIIRYTGQGGLTPGFTLNLTVTATNASNSATATVAVSITVQGVTITAPGQLYLPATGRTAAVAVVLGTFAATAASDEPITYSLVTVVAATSAVPTADKFAIGRSSGVVIYTGAETEDATVNSDYTLIVRATSGAYTAGAMVTVNIGICDRTALVRDEIVRLIRVIRGFVDSCGKVNVSGLARVTNLELNSQTITSLIAWDFAGLSDLTDLNLGGNQLSTFPAGVFADLGNLTDLELYGNQLGTLPEDVFDGLSNLTDLALYDNQLGTLPEDVFDGLSNLTDLALYDNQLGTLPEGVFDGLSSLRVLALYNNQLGTLPEGVFDGLSNLTVLNLQLQANSQLSTLPAGVFDDLSKLTTLNLYGNQLSTLPAGVFDDLSKLTTLNLYGNQLGTLPTGVFAKLSNLTTLALYDNRLGTLPAGVFASLSKLTALELHNNHLNVLPKGVFAGLTNLTTLNLVGNSATFTVTFGLEQLVNNAGSSVFRVRSDFAGPAVAVTYQLAGGSATVSGSVQVPAGTTISSTFTVPAASGHTTGSLTGGTLGTGFSGFDVGLGAPLIINAPAFSEPQGYEFHTLYSFSVNGDTLGTVTAIDPIGTGSTLSYQITDASNNFTIGLNDGVIGYDGSGNELPGNSYDLIVTATVVSVSTTVAVTIVVNSPPQLGAIDPFVLPVIDRSALPSYTLGMIRATDADDEPLTYTLTNVVATAPGATTAAKFVVDPNGALHYIGIAPEDAVKNAGYTLTVHITDGRQSVVVSVPISIGICDRSTVQVRDGIASFLGVLGCQNVTLTGLRSATGTLDLSNSTTTTIVGEALTSLVAGDFDGLSSLEELHLYGNDLSVLPEDVFAGLSSLEELHLYGNDLSVLPEDVFAGLSSLEELHLYGNDLSVLPTGVFAGLSSLEELHLYGNDLSVLPTGVFAGLSSLNRLDLDANRLSALPAGVFADLDLLERLFLNTNRLSSLPVTVFNGLSNLNRLDLYDNQLSALPTGVFAGLSSLEYLHLYGNDLSALPTGVFVPLVALLTLTLGNNSLSTLPEGAFSNLTNLDVLRLNNNSLSTLPAEAFSNLTALRRLDLNDNSLTTLPAGVFSNLTDLIVLVLNNNPWSSLPTNAFVGLTNLSRLNVETSSGGLFGVSLSIEQLSSDFAAGALVFRVRSGFPGPVSTINWIATGDGIAATTITGTVRIPAGSITGTTFTLPINASYSNVALTDSSFAAGFTGFTSNFTVPPPIVNLRFTQPNGYVFHTLYPETASRTILGTVTVVAFGNIGSSPGYVISDLANNSPSFEIDSSGAIRYVGPGNEIAGNSYSLTVRSGNGNITASVAVEIMVNQAPSFLAFDAMTPFYLTANRANLGTVTATDPNNDPIAYSITAITALVPGTATADKFDIASTGVLRYIGIYREDVTANASYALTVRATAGGGFATTEVMVNIGICDRTAQVRDGIVALIGATNCQSVTAASLQSEIGRLDLSNQTLTSLVTGDFAGMENLTGLNLFGNPLNTLTVGVFEGLIRLAELNIRRSANDDTFLVNLWLEQLEDIPGSQVFRLRSDFAGPAYSEVIWEASGSAAAATSTVSLAAGSTASEPFTLPPGYTSIALTSANPDAGFLGFLTRFVATLIVDAPRFDQRSGYQFHTLYPGSATSTILGTVTAVIPGNNNEVPGYRITAPTNNSLFEVYSNGVIDYRGNGGEIPGARYTLIVTATDPSNNVVADAVVTIVVNSPPQFSSIGPFALGLSNVLGTVAVTDADQDNVTYTLTGVRADSGVAMNDKFAVDPDGTLRYTGSGTEDVTDNDYYVLTIRATDVANSASFRDGQALVNIGICDRTPEVRTAIVVDINTIYSGVVCQNVTTGDLGVVNGDDGTLDLSNRGLTSVGAADFAGLGLLTYLLLNGNSLSSLPAGAFADLSNLRRLDLYGNSLSSLPAGVFTGLSNLEQLYMFTNRLPTLPAGVFADLGNLRQLDLYNNRLTILPAGVFDALTSLEELYLDRNRLTNLPPGSWFYRLDKLTHLDLKNNRLTSLPSDLADLGALEEVSLENNQLNDLPAGVFYGLTNLRALSLDGNPGADYRVNFELEQLADNAGSSAFQVRIDFAGPAYSEVGVEATGEGVTVASGVVTIAAGTTISTMFTLSEGYTSINVTNARLANTFTGFVNYSAPALTINAPRFEQAAGYTFNLSRGQVGSGAAPIALGTVAAPDPNGQDVDYSVVSGNTSRFSLNTNSGAISYIGTGESTSGFYTLTIEASDGALTASVEVRINVINDAPVFDLADADYVFSLNEAQSDDQNTVLIGTVSATDPNGDTVGYLIGGGDTSRFRVGFSSGVIRYDNTGELAGTLYTLTMYAVDSDLLADTVLVTIGVVNRPPVFNPTAFGFTVNENQPGTATPIAIGTVTATDPDNNPLTYSIITGDSNRFSLTADNGTLHYIGVGEPISATHALIVQVSDDYFTAAAVVEVRVRNEPPVFDASAYTFFLTKDTTGNNIPIGSVSASDSNNDPLTYTIIAGDTATFSLGLNSGTLFYTGGGEGQGTVRDLIIVVTDDNSIVGVEVTVNVTDNPPQFNFPIYTFSISGGQSGAEVPLAVGTVVATDLNNDILRYFVDDIARFRIGSVSGFIEYIGSGETTGNTLNLTVAAIDQNNASTVAVEVAVVNDAPIFDPATYSFTMSGDVGGAPTAMPVGTVTAIDPNGDALDYSIISDDVGDRFRIDPATGFIEYTRSGSGEVSGVNLILTVIVTDEHGYTAAATVTIAVRPIAVGMRTQMTSMSLAQVGRNIAIDTVDVIGGRFVAVPHVTVSGYALNAQQWQGAARWMQWDHWQSVGAWNGAEREITWDDIDLGPRWDRFRDNLLTGTSFLVSLGAVEGEGGEEETEGESSGWFGDWSLGLQDWSLWGQGRISGYEYTAGGMKVDGQVLSGYFGVDYQVNDELLFGVAVSRSGSEGHSQMSDGSNRTDIDTVLASVYPYLHWTPVGTGFEFWGAIGRGAGEIDVTDANRSNVVADLSLIASAFGAEQGLLWSGDGKIAVKVDGFAVQMKSDGVSQLNATNSESHRLRAALAGSYNWLVDDYSHIFGGLELGARLDGGDAVQGLGLDLGANLGYANTTIGLETHSRVRFLVAHSDEYSDWGLDMTVRLRPGQLGRGLAVSLAPGWGQAATAIDSLWKNGAAALKPTVASGRGLIPDRTKLSIHYGLHYRRALWSPFAEMGMERDDVSALRLGLRVDTPQLWMEVFGSRDRSIGIESVFSF